MRYENRQRTSQAEFFNGKCGGKFNVREYPFVLKEEYRKDNLYEGIADKAIQYFEGNNIRWWRCKGELPTNHTLSSQVACINHLFWLNTNPDAATMVLKEIDPEFVAIPFPDTGKYVEFELNGCDYYHNNYLGEQGKTRGANTTSIDAAMLAQKNDKTILVFIEWKYVEKYYEKPEAAAKHLKYEVQKKTYKDLLINDTSPIILDKNKTNSTCDYDKSYEKFSVEPFYQLMRQTLLAWRLTEDRRFGATDYIHIHVIPDGNEALMKGQSSIEITGNYKNICDGWASWLKHPGKYRHFEPFDLISKAARLYDISIHKYLNDRYWS